MFTVGSEGLYQWLVSDQQFDLLQVCPEVVLGKYVAITSIDSGPLVLSDHEKAAGWQSREKIAYSPSVLKVEDLPRMGWDERYIFDKPTDLGTSHLGENIFEVPQQEGNVSVFVNYCFALHNPEMNSLISLFWQQMKWIRPESFVADSEYLTFVSANKSAFARAREAVEALG